MESVEEGQLVGGKVILALYFGILGYAPGSSREVLKVLKAKAGTRSPLEFSCSDLPHLTEGTVVKCVSDLNTAARKYCKESRTQVDAKLREESIEADGLTFGLVQKDSKESWEVVWVKTTGRVSRRRRPKQSFLDYRKHDPSVVAATSVPNVMTEMMYEVRPLATLDELRLFFALNWSAYDSLEGTISFETMRRWWESYPRGFSGIFERRRLVGAVVFWPLSEDDVRDLEAGGIAELEMVPSAEVSVSNWYAFTLVVTPESHGRPVTAVLLRDTLWSWLEDSRLAFPMTIWALGFGEDGPRLLDRFGFKERGHAEKMKDKMPLHALVARSKENLLEALRGGR